MSARQSHLILMALTALTVSCRDAAEQWDGEARGGCRHEQLEEGSVVAERAKQGLKRTVPATAPHQCGLDTERGQSQPCGWLDLSAPRREVDEPDATQQAERD